MQNLLRTGLSRLKDIQDRIEEKFDDALRDVDAGNSVAQQQAQLASSAAAVTTQLQALWQVVPGVAKPAEEVLLEPAVIPPPPPPPPLDDTPLEDSPYLERITPSSSSEVSPASAALCRPTHDNAEVLSACAITNGTPPENPYWGSLAPDPPTPPDDSTERLAEAPSPSTERQVASREVPAYWTVPLTNVDSAAQGSGPLAPGGSQSLLLLDSLQGDPSLDQIVESNAAAVFEESLKEAECSGSASIEDAHGEPSGVMCAHSNEFVEPAATRLLSAEGAVSEALASDTSLFEALSYEAAACEALAMDTAAAEVLARDSALIEASGIETAVCEVFAMEAAAAEALVTETTAAQTLAIEAAAAQALAVAAAATQDLAIEAAAAAQALAIEAAVSEALALEGVSAESAVAKNYATETLVAEAAAIEDAARALDSEAAVSQALASNAAVCEALVSETAASEAAVSEAAARESVSAKAVHGGLGAAFGSSGGVPTTAVGAPLLEPLNAVPEAPPRIESTESRARMSSEEVLRQALRDMREENVGFRAALEEMTSTLVCRNEEVAELRRQLNDMETAAQQKTALAVELERRCQDAAVVKYELEVRIADQAAQLADMDLRLRKHKEQVNSQDALHLESLQRKAALLEAAMAESERKVYDAETALAAMKEESRGVIENAKADAMAAVAGAHRRIARLEKEKKTLEEQLRQLRTEAAAASATVPRNAAEDLQARLTAYKAEFEARSAERTGELAEALRTAEEKAQAAETQAREANTRVLEITHNFHAAQRRIATLVEEAEHWRNMQKIQQLQQQQMPQLNLVCSRCKTAAALQSVLAPPPTTQTPFLRYNLLTPSTA